MTEPSAEPQNNRSCLFVGLAVVLVLAILGGIAWWWFNRPIEPVILTPQEKVTVEEKIEVLQEPTYTPGVREIVLTERELNGLLNQQTTMGDSVRLELGTDAIHARVETDLAEDFPILGGKRLKAKARLLIKDDVEGVHLVVEDVTVWGVSMPNEWLGGIKGKDLFAEIFGGKSGRLAGVESMKVMPGELKVVLKE